MCLFLWSYRNPKLQIKYICYFERQKLSQISWKCIGQKWNIIIYFLHHLLTVCNTQVRSTEPSVPSPRAIFPLSRQPGDLLIDRCQFCITSSGSGDANISVPAELHLLPSIPCILLTRGCCEMPQSATGISLTAPALPQRWQLLTGLLSIVSESLFDESDS